MANLQGGLGKRPALIAFGVGLVAAAGQAPVSLPWLTLAGLAVAYLLFTNETRAKRAAWIGWAFGTGYFAAALFWIVEPFMVDPVRHGWMAPFALIGLAGGLALFWALAFGLAKRVKQGWWRALAWAVLLSAAELARSYVFTGFPWALIGHVWVGWAPMQLAAWVGPVGLTFLTVLPVALGIAAWSRKAFLLPILGTCAALYGFGLWQQAQPMPETLEPKILRLVQPNAAQHLKWDPDYAPLFFADAVAFTRAPATPRPDLIIWPETAVPVLLERAAGAFQRITAAADGVPLVLGIQRYDGMLAYNSLVYLDGQGALTALYDKHHLVPFGEYLPGSGLFLNTRLAGLVGDYGYSSGPGAELVDLGPLGRVLPLICYEAIFPQDVRAAPERPDWLLQITNDAWFGTLSGPYQHLAQARLRAVEQGLPFVRAANTGVSAVIDARGKVTAFLPLGQAGYLDASLPPALPATLYARTGDAPVAVLLALLGLMVFAFRARKPIDAPKADP